MMGQRYHECHNKSFLFSNIKSIPIIHHTSGICTKVTETGAKIFPRTHRSIMCGLKKLASQVFPVSWKVLAELRRRRKQTKNNKSGGDLITCLQGATSRPVHATWSHCDTPWCWVAVDEVHWLGQNNPPISFINTDQIGKLTILNNPISQNVIWQLKSQHDFTKLYSNLYDIDRLHLGLSNYKSDLKLDVPHLQDLDDFHN